MTSQGKNQKAITQFFKTVPCSQEKISPVKLQQSVETKAKTSKRKADSPNIVNHKDGITSSSINFSNNTLKKVKIGENHGDKVIFNKTSNFPGKPNCAKVTISPKKEHVTKKLFVDTEDCLVSHINHEENPVQDSGLKILKVKSSPKRNQRRSNEKENCIQYIGNNVEIVVNNLISNNYCSIEKQYQSPKKNLTGMFQY